MVTRVGVCRSFNKFDAVHQQILTCVVTGGFWDLSYVSRYHPREQWRPSRAWKSFCRNGLPRAVGWVSVSIDIVATVSFSLRSLSSFALCISLSGFASAASLIDAIDAARAYDAGYSAARNAQDAGHQKRWQGIAGLLPRAQFDASYTKQDQPSAAYAAAVRRHDYSASVTQPIFDMAKIADFKRGAALSDVADVDFAKAQQQLITDVSSAYFDVLFEREALSAATAAEKAFSQQLEQAKSALELGEGTRTEVDEAQANYDQARAKEIAAANDLEIAQAAYGRLTGLQADVIEAMHWQCVPMSAGLPLDAALSQAEIDNLDVRSAQLQLQQSRADILTASASHLPVISAQASYGTNWSRGSDQNALDDIFGTTSKTRNTLIGVNLTIPIFSGGSGISQMREAYSRRYQASDALEDARRKARQDSRAAFLNVTNGVVLIRAQERALASSKSKVDSTLMGREVGLRTTIDVLNAQQRYFEGIRDLADARYKYLKARLQLSASLGALNDADVMALSCHQPG
ncbi:MAG: TolC family outer membrane protein [Ralstonia sp.]|jgi:outer membrane protein